MFVLLGLFAVTLVVRNFRSPPDLLPSPATVARPDPSIFPATSISYGAERHPQLIAATDADIDKNELIVGVVEKDGEAHAYVLSALTDPSHHVVLDEIGGKPIAVTHCPRTGVTRVFTSPEGSAPLEVECNGWLEQQDMALLVDGQIYGHSSRHVPLEEVASSVTTWESWNRDQPDSLVYMGDSTPDAESSEHP